MTAQIGENLRYEGKDYSMCTEPLNQYFELGGAAPKFESPSSALWRGYIGKWEIIENRLYLIELEGFLEDEIKVTLEALFPNYPKRVFVHWYCGILRLPEGKMLKYEHMGYGSTFERDILIKIHQGVVKDVTIEENGVSDNPDGIDGYGAAAFTTFSCKKEEDK